MYRIAVESGVRCSVLDLSPKNRTVVVFVHGWPLSHEIFDCQYTVLPEYGIRCIAVDLRGFGESDKPFDGYTYDCLAEDLHRIISSIDCRCVALCGFSMGGAVCARYLSRFGSQRVNKLILCGAACPSFVARPGYPYGFSREKVDSLIAEGYNNRPQLCYDFSRMCFAANPGERTIDWVANLCLQTPGYALIQCAEQLRDEDLRRDLTRIQIPTAILHGRQDQICPFPFAEEMHRSIPNSFVVPFEHSGHFLFYEERDLFNNSLIDFLMTN